MHTCQITLPAVIFGIENDNHPSGLSAIGFQPPHRSIWAHFGMSHTKGKHKEMKFHAPASRLGILRS